MALTFRQKQDLNDFLFTLELLTIERRDELNRFYAERDPFTTYSAPEFDINEEGGVWPPHHVNGNNNGN